jgi:hypothetical protein
VCLPLVDCVEGDGRSFDSGAGLNESTATILIDFETGRIRAGFNYSCDEDDCKSARPVAIEDWSGDDFWPNFVNTAGDNGVAFNQDGSSLSLVISGRLSVGPPLSPSINGRIDLEVDANGFAFATKEGNGFPAYEIYQVTGGNTLTVGQYNAGSPAALFDGPVGGIGRLVDWIF